MRDRGASRRLILRQLRGENNHQAFKNHLRDFLVQTKGFASERNAELYAEETAARLAAAGDEWSQVAVAAVAAAAQSARRPARRGCTRARTREASHRERAPIPTTGQCMGLLFGHAYQVT